MPRVSFALRDVFWLTLVVGLALGWVIDRGKLNAEVKYLKSSDRTVEYIEVPFREVQSQFWLTHGVWVDVDWDSFPKGSPYHEDMLVTLTLKNASIQHQLDQMFYGQAVVTPSVNSRGYSLLTVRAVDFAERRKDLGKAAITE